MGVAPARPDVGARLWRWRPRDIGVPLFYVFLAALLGLIVTGLLGMRELAAALALVAVASISVIMLVPGRAERERRAGLERRADVARAPPAPAPVEGAGLSAASSRPGQASRATEGEAHGASPSRAVRGRDAP